MCLSSMAESDLRRSSPARVRERGDVRHSTSRTVARQRASCKPDGTVAAHAPCEYQALTANTRTAQGQHLCTATQTTARVILNHFPNVSTMKQCCEGKLDLENITPRRPFVCPSASKAGQRRIGCRRSMRRWAWDGNPVCALLNFAFFRDVYPAFFCFFSEAFRTWSLFVQRWTANGRHCSNGVCGVV